MVKCKYERETLGGANEVGAVEFWVIIEVSFANDAILPSKYLSNCKLANGLLRKN